MLADLFMKEHIRYKIRDGSDNAQDSDDEVKEERKRQVQISAAESEFENNQAGRRVLPMFH